MVRWIGGPGLRLRLRPGPGPGPGLRLRRERTYGYGGSCRGGCRGGSTDVRARARVRADVRSRVEAGGSFVVLVRNGLPSRHRRVEAWRSGECRVPHWVEGGPFVEHGRPPSPTLERASARTSARARTSVDPPLHPPRQFPPSPRASDHPTGGRAAPYPPFEPVDRPAPSGERNFHPSTGVLRRPVAPEGS